MLRQRFLTSRTGSKAALTCAVLWLMAASSIGAQEPLTGFLVQTGLKTFLASPRRSADVIVTELGGRSVTSTVRLTVYGPDDQVVMRDEAPLQRGQPALFRFRLTSTTPRLLRFSIAIFGVTGRNSQAVVEVEDVDEDRFTIGERFSCSLPANREGPVTPLCDGGIVNDITIGG